MFFVQVHHGHYPCPPHLDSVQRLRNSFGRRKYVEKKLENFYLLLCSSSYTCSEDNDTLCFVDGHIDNLKDLAKQLSLAVGASPSETIKTIFHKQPLDFFSNFRGQFVCGIYDKKKNLFFLLNDRFGIKPCFYLQDRQAFVACSRLSTLAPASPDLNLKAIAQYFRLGLTLEGESFLTKIKPLLPGSLLQFSKQSCTVTKSREKDIEPFQGTLLDAAEELFLIFTTAVQKSLKNYNPQVCYLTGGTDTRLLLAAMHEIGHPEIEFLTYSSPVWNSSNGDLLIAKELAKKYGLKHRVSTYFQKKATPFHSIRDFHFLMHTPSLTGTFGTELLGHLIFSRMPYRKALLNEASETEKYTQLVSSTFLAGFEDPKITLHSEVEEENGPCKEYSFGIKRVWRSSFSSLHSDRNTWTFIQPFENFNKDKVVPFLDQDVLDFLITLPLEYLQNYRIYGALFKGLLRPWIRIPLHSGIHNYICDLPKPTGLITEPANQTPVSRRELCLQNLKHPSLQIGLFNLDYLKKALLDPESEKGLAVKLCDFIGWYHVHIDDSIPLEEF